MCGFLESYEQVIECAKHLREHIIAVCEGRNITRDIPEVTLILWERESIIEVDGVLVWDSRLENYPLGPAEVIESFKRQCSHLSNFRGAVE